MLILDLWGVSFHAVVVFGLGNNLLFKSVLGHCVDQSVNYLRVNTYKEFFKATLKLICNECNHVFFDVVVSLSGSSIVFEW